MGMCLRVLKESNKSRFNSYSRQEQSIDHNPCYLSGLSRAHFFPTTFLEIAVSLYTSLFSAEASPIWRSLKGWGEEKKKARGRRWEGEEPLLSRERILRVCQSLLDSFL